MLLNFTNLVYFSTVHSASDFWRIAYLFTADVWLPPCDLPTWEHYTVKNLIRTCQACRHSCMLSMSSQILKISEFIIFLWFATDSCTKSASLLRLEGCFDATDSQTYTLNVDVNELSEISKLIL